MKKPKLCIAVTGLNAIDSPGPGVAVIRALRESRDFEVSIIGLSYDSLEPGIYMHDMVHKTYRIPLPSSGIKVLMDRIVEIHKKEKLDLIIPNFDAELFNFINLTTPLEKLGIRTFLPTIQQFEERHKSNLSEYGVKYKIKVPRSKLIFIDSEIASLSEEFSYPLVVKGKFYDAYIAYSEEQAQSYFSKLSARWGLPVIIQEFVKGAEVNVTAIGDGKGKTIGAVPMRKQYITDKGKAWAGISIDDKKLLSIAEKLIQNTKWRGGVELEMIKSANGEYYLLEVNPRFPAWVYLAVGCGQNHPEALVKMAMGQRVKPYTKYQVGKMFVRYAWDMIVDLKEFEKISTQGEL
ncbi:MAG TPA: ATP-grasp domain-containing protein [Cyclobacteriaceae bacterium]|nr:ATP-grasp domain-containing protein [Cyclobacteriaceae bacterium]